MQSNRWPAGRNRRGPQQRWSALLASDRLIPAHWLPAFRDGHPMWTDPGDCPESVSNKLEVAMAGLLAALRHLLNPLDELVFVLALGTLS